MSNESNAAQREFWNGPAGDVWTEAQEYMDRMLAPLSDAAVARAAPVSGERVIDVGCGCGGTSLALAGSGAAVWGVDVSEPMVARAKERAAGLGNVAFSVADAATQSYTPDHQLIFSRFGVMFFDDPKSAFANLRTGLSSGGRLVFICWQAFQKNAWVSVAGQAARPFMPPAGEAPDPRAPGPFAFADEAWVSEILSSAGFADIAFESLTPALNVGRDIDEAMYLQARIGPIARGLGELDDDRRAQAIQAVRDALAPYATSRGVELPCAVWLVSATNP